MGPGAGEDWVPGKIEIGRGDEVAYGRAGIWRELPARYSNGVRSTTVIRARSLELPQPNKIQSGQNRTLIFSGRTGERRKANEGVALTPGGSRKNREIRHCSRLLGRRRPELDGAVRRHRQPGQRRRCPSRRQARHPSRRREETRCAIVLERVSLAPRSKGFPITRKGSEAR